MPSQQSLFMQRTLVLALWMTMEVQVSFAQTSSCISPQCRCTVQRDIPTATCTLRNLSNLKYLITRPQDIIALDLSSNEINEVPGGVFENFTKLQSLSLANNSIQKLDSRVFLGLRNLTSLNISLNPLQSWQGDANNGLMSLERVDVTGISTWVPGTNVMQLTSLTEIVGTSWNKHCRGCSLVKSFNFQRNSSQPRCSKVENIASETCTDCLPIKCRCTSHLFSKESVNFARHGFVFGKCSHLRKCQNSLSIKSLDDPCVRKNAVFLAIIQYPISLIGIVLNLVTAFHILSTKSLSSNVPMLLITHMALCDLSSCLDAFIITSVLLAVPYNVFLDNVRSICLPLGLLWFVGICGSTIVSSLLTVERYLAIVFAMKPSVRMRRKSAIICLLITWLILLTLGFYSLAEEFSIRNSFCIPGSSTSKSPKHLTFIIPVGISGMALILVNTILYIHIYFVVRKSQQNMGIKKETKTAKRIAILVFTNMFFFFAPTFMTGILVISDTYPTIQADGKGEMWRMVVALYFPVVCFNLNACMNPLWYAFRNKKFKDALKERLASLMLQLRNARHNVGMFFCSKNAEPDKPKQQDKNNFDTAL